MTEHGYDPAEIAKRVGIPGGVRFADVLEHHLNMKLQRYQKRDFDEKTMEEIYDDILLVIGPLLEGKGFSNEAIRWLTEAHYELIKVSDSEIITRDESTWKHQPKRFYEPVKIERLTDRELRMFAGLFNESEFAPKLVDELNRRNIR